MLEATVYQCCESLNVLYNCVLQELTDILVKHALGDTVTSFGGKTLNCGLRKLLADISANDI